MTVFVDWKDILVFGIFGIAAAGMGLLCVAAKVENWIRRRNGK